MRCPTSAQPPHRFIAVILYSLACATACDGGLVAPSVQPSQGILSSTQGSSQSGNQAPATRPPLTSPNDLPNAEHPSSKISVQPYLARDGNQSGYVPVYANANISASAFAVDRLVLILHDAGRDAEFQAQTALTAVTKAGGDVHLDSTLIVAPLFADTDNTLPKEFTARPALLWADNGYMAGFNATSGARVSSFAVIDTWLVSAANLKTFPALKTVYVIGHSAGAQTVDRYAIGGKQAQAYGAAAPHLLFAVANSSSYTYFDTKRPDNAGAFVPFDSKSCAAFNTWKYGVTSMPSYFVGQNAASLANGYIGRNVSHLLGTQDTDADSASIDNSCCARAQGDFRLVRGEHYFEYLGKFSTPSRQKLCKVEGVGHDTEAMLTSECLLSILRQ